MSELIQHPAFKYVRDYQTVAFSRINLVSGQSKTATMTLPFRFIVTKLAATVYRRNAGPPIVGVEVFDAPITTLIRQHTNALDNSPVPLRGAWGTARQPKILPIPWALEQGTAMSVECANLVSNAPAAVGANSFDVFLTLHGYQPSDEEFEAIRQYNDARFVRPYQTFTMAPVGTKTFLDVNDTNRIWNTNFPLDFITTHLTGMAYNVTAASEVSGFIVAVADPPVIVQLQQKAANLNTAQEAFRSILGDGTFQCPVKPQMVMKQGDFLNGILSNLDGSLQMAVFITLIGYIPTDLNIRRSDIERGRSKPQVYIPSIPNKPVSR